MTNPESAGEPKYREEEVPDDLHNCAHGLHYVLYSRPLALAVIFRFMPFSLVDDEVS